MLVPTTFAVDDENSRVQDVSLAIYSAVVQGAQTDRAPDWVSSTGASVQDFVARPGTSCSRRRGADH